MKEARWSKRAPKASAEEWAETWERLTDLMPYDFVATPGRVDELLRFVLQDAMDLCMAEAESRKPGVINERIWTAEA